MRGDPRLAGERSLSSISGSVSGRTMLLAVDLTLHE